MPTPSVSPLCCCCDRWGNGRASDLSGAAAGTRVPVLHLCRTTWPHSSTRRHGQTTVLHPRRPHKTHVGSHWAARICCTHVPWLRRVAFVPLGDAGLQPEGSPSRGHSPPPPLAQVPVWRPGVWASQPQETSVQTPSQQRGLGHSVLPRLCSVGDTPGKAVTGLRPTVASGTQGEPGPATQPHAPGERAARALPTTPPTNFTARSSRSLGHARPGWAVIFHSHLVFIAVTVVRQEVMLVKPSHCQTAAKWTSTHSSNTSA